MKITDVSLGNIVEGPVTYGRDDMDLGFQNIWYILDPTFLVHIVLIIFIIFLLGHTVP